MESCYWKGETLHGPLPPQPDDPPRLRPCTQTHRRPYERPATGVCFASRFPLRLAKHGDTAGAGLIKVDPKANIALSSHHSRPPPPFTEYQSQKSCQEPTLINFKLNRKLFPTPRPLKGGSDLEQSRTPLENSIHLRNARVGKGRKKKKRHDERRERKKKKKKKSQALIRSNYSLFISNMMK